METKLSHDMFADQLNEDFQVPASANGAVELKLIQCRQLTDHAASALGPRQVPFALLFRGPANTQLQQGIHRLINPAMGEFEIFLVPVGRDAGGIQYEAIFN